MIFVPFPLKAKDETHCYKIIIKKKKLKSCLENEKWEWKLYARIERINSCKVSHSHCKFFFFIYSSKSQWEPCNEKGMSYQIYCVSRTIYHFPRRPTFFLPDWKNMLQLLFPKHNYLIPAKKQLLPYKNAGWGYVPLHCCLSSSSVFTAMPKSARGRQKRNIFSTSNHSKSISDYSTNMFWVICRLHGVS